MNATAQVEKPDDAVTPAKTDAAKTPGETVTAKTPGDTVTTEKPTRASTPAKKPAAAAAKKPAARELLHERMFQVLLRPLISEKTTATAEKHRQIAFQVLPNAGKTEIKRAVEALFEVKVQSVQVANMRGKVKRGRTPGKRSNWKKAYVRLQEGHDIDFVGMSGA